MKIAFCAPTDVHALARYAGYPVENIAMGLGSTATTPLIIELLKIGHQITVYTLSNDLAGERVYEWSNLRVFVGPSRLFGSPRDFYRSEIDYLARIIKADAPDFLHAHWTYEFALGALYSRVPTIITIHDLPWNVLRYYRDRCRTVRLFMAYIVAIRGDTFTAVSNDAARHFCRWFRPGSSIRVIPNFLPHETYSHGYDYTKQNNHRLTFVTVLQGWSRRKNGRCALAAFQIVRKQLPDARMVMIGTDYELNGPANIWASSHGLTEQVTFKGSMTHESMLRYIAQETDILVHPSLDEAFSVTVLECMALRKPVIGGINTPGLREVLNHGKVGLLVDVCSPYAVSESMHNLATNLILHRQMADAAFDRAWNDFRAEIVVPQYESLYEEFISQTKTVSVGPNGKQVST